MLKAESTVQERKSSFDQFCKRGRWQCFQKTKMTECKSWKVMKVAAQKGKRREIKL